MKEYEIVCILTLTILNFSIQGNNIILLMLSGFPVPDFECLDNFDDIDQFENAFENGNPPVLSHFPIKNDNQSSTLTENEQIALNEKGLIVLDQSTPIRSTSNSTVYAAKSPKDGQMFALKVTSHRKRAQTEYQKRNLISNQSPYLLKSISLYESPATPKVILQMELCENGDIKSMMASMVFWPEDIIWKLIHDVAHALVELHKENWMHLDVSPGNILVSNDCFKLSDFGTMTRVGDFEEGMEGAGPYVSPEALSYPLGPYTVNQQTDIFSFGVVLLEVATGKQAPRGGTPGYSLLRRDELKLKLKQSSLSSSRHDDNLQPPNNRRVNLMMSPVNKKSNKENCCQEYECWCSPVLIELINSMLSSDPSQRPSSYDLCQILQVARFD